MKKSGIVFGLTIATLAPVLWFFLASERGTAGDFLAHLQANGLKQIEYEVPDELRASESEEYALDSPAGVARIVQVRRDGEGDTVVIQAGVVPGTAKLVKRSSAGSAPVKAFPVEPDWADRNDNGFPDSVELANPADSRAFLDWFRFLAEEQFYRGDDTDPEINDCAALLRYSYREALRRHDGDWAVRIGLKAVKPIPDVAKFQYPFTPLRADLFRLKPGAFEVEDLDSGAFGQFADAETLLLYNTNPIGKDILQARPGDVLFYRQEGQQMPFHAMLYLGPSTMEQREDDNGRNEDYVIYHTGPDGSWKGEMRRRTVGEMVRHPEPRWHPVPANPAFLGVYRWKILGSASGT